ncbi:MAG: FAD-dependent oxidoreductase [Devosia sp.]
MAQPNRLPAEGDHRLKGTEIDRGRPIGFRLDGREIQGFAGDTLLSALLASGITGAGTHGGEVLALDERFAPPMLLRGHAHNRLRALSPERAPAADGLDLVTLSRSQQGRYGRAMGLLRSLKARRGRRLDLDYDDDDASLAGPWFDAPAERELTADLVVVGGGLAGIGAALATAKRGDRVVLIERRSWLGGEVRFFGTGDEAQSPDELVAKLTASINGFANITMLLAAEAFAAFEGMVRVNQVVLEHGVPVSRGIAISAPRIVLATGAIDRLPIFAGNQTPGVVSALAAFNRADRYGVWIGREALFATATNFGYRAAMPAVDAGVAVSRIADTRLDPQSRYISFAKAYGLGMVRSLKPRKAVPGKRGGLAVDFDHTPEETTRPGEHFITGQLVVSGGWQPDLMLWHMAGGSSRWIVANNRLEAEGQLPGIALAGAVAGFRNASACLASGEAAANRLFGRSVPDIADPQIDPVYESADDPTPVGLFDLEAEVSAYLDGGDSLAARPRPVRGWRRLLGRAGARRWGLDEQARPLGVADVAAGVQLGLIPPDDAAIVAQERCVTPGDIVDAGRLPGPLAASAQPLAGAPPTYLSGRFGPKPSIWLVEPHDGRSFEPGCLVYANADPADPLAAIGVVFAPAPEGRKGGLAVMIRSASEGDTPVVRDVSGQNSVRLVDPYKVEQPPTDAIKQIAGDGSKDETVAGGISVETAVKPLAAAENADAALSTPADAIPTQPVTDQSSAQPPAATKPSELPSPAPIPATEEASDAETSQDGATGAAIGPEPDGKFSESAEGSASA